MTKALERAARALREAQDSVAEFEGAAKAALLAALDPEDEELEDALAEAIDDLYSDHDAPSSGYRAARVAIDTIRNHICGESSDGG